MGFRVIIPARYASHRLPGKPLIDICGKPMIQHMYERAIESGADSVVIATDDERIKKVAENFHADVCMTSIEHQSGTERLSEALVALSYAEDEVVVNLQADNPLIPPEVIHQVATELTQHDNIKMATVCEPITKVENLFNPDVVKVVMNKRGKALYFSRAPIAWERGVFNKKKEIKGTHYRHIGTYAYRIGFLQEYMKWARCDIEKMERLEQLRVLWNGGRIHVTVSKKPVPFSIETKEDLKRVIQVMEKIHSEV